MKKGGSFLNVTDANIEQGGLDDGAPSSSQAAEGNHMDGAASTPRAAPCIALPKQHHEALRHVAIGAPLPRPTDVWLYIQPQP